MSRKSIPSVVQADVVIKSKRRCALCVSLDSNDSERPGQIAHLSGDHSDNRFENLVWLCLEHHDKFDSKTSQTKNYTPLEVRNYRDMLYQTLTAYEYTPDDISLTRNYLSKYGRMFGYIFQEYDELAFKIDHNMMETLAEIRYSWNTDTLRSFNASLREIQDHIANKIVGILSVYDEIDMYYPVGNWIKFDTKNFPHETLTRKKGEMRSFVDALAGYYKQLQAIAVK